MMQNKRLIGIVLTVTLLLLIPFFAMQFTDEVKWSLPDFVGAGVLLLGTRLLCELVIKKVKKNRVPALYLWIPSIIAHSYLAGACSRNLRDTVCRKLDDRPYSSQASLLNHGCQWASHL